ncbi:MAG: hypothetical protein SFW35_03070 [Chitinophagales bacterium]|nr:hypothetical protein [Chitinophagales bacterium]
MPLVAVAKSEHWTRKDLFKIALLSASAHVLGTVLLGILLGYIGVKLAMKFDEIMHLIAPLVLIIFGIIYFSINLPHHHHPAPQEVAAYKRSKKSWLWLFVLMMFLSPCLEVEGLFLSAGIYGTTQVMVLATIYGIVSITSIVAFVMLVHNGIELLQTDFFEKHEKRITGVILIIVGIVTFFIH